MHPTRSSPTSIPRSSSRWPWPGATYMAPIGGSFGFCSMGGSHGGAVAGLLAVPAASHLLVTAPAGLPATVLATLSDNVVDGYRSVGPSLADRPGADVLIVADAPGSVGLYAAAAAVALNPGHVRLVDTDPDRVRAAALGVDATCHRGAWPRRFGEAPITVDATGHPDGLATVLRSTARYGHCTILAFGFDPATPVPLPEMYTRESPRTPRGRTPSVTSRTSCGSSPPPPSTRSPSRPRSGPGSKPPTPGSSRPPS